MQNKISGIGYIDVHTHHFNEQANVLGLLNVYPEDLIPQQPYLSCGIHPRQINEQSYTKELERIEALLKDGQLMAIGETGLDKRIDAPAILQEEVFIRHIQLAEAYNKPLIIHCVKAHNDVIRLMNKLKPAVPFIFHAYNQNAQITKALLNYPVYFSLGKALHHANSHAQQLLKTVDLNRLFFETDDEKTNIAATYCKAAEILQVEEAVLIEQIKNNFAEVFSITFV